MNKYQRAKKRIIRDRENKSLKRTQLYKEADSFNDVITMQNFLRSLKNCRKNVSWKGSVQRYTFHAITEMYRAYTTLHEGKLPKVASSKKILLNERGKLREIVPVKIQDRIIQRVLCDNSLVPVIKNTLIYDNGASLKDKGVEFTRRRLLQHIKHLILENGSDFYVGLFDFKSFFDSIPHKACLNVLDDNFKDRQIKELAMGIIKSYERVRIQQLKDDKEKETGLNELESNQSRGICLGSQVSQIMALAVPNKLDHLIKDTFRVKHYLRYMDDGVLFSKSKKFLHQIFNRMERICKELGLKFNPKKTRIVKVSKGFCFLKVLYRVTATGKIIKKLTRSGVVRMRRKLKRFSGLVAKEKMSLEDTSQSIQSWFSHSKVAMAYHTRQNMANLYQTLFGSYCYS